jgi:hypothetical protein
VTALAAPPASGYADGGVVLTAHPLQRVGAYALAALAQAGSPAVITAETLAKVVRRMADDAVEAALVRDTKRPDGFWLKCSHSFFPNAPMNHPGNGKKQDGVVEAAVLAWRSPPADRPDVPCVLCGRAAVGYFGKMDVPLAESDAYRNSTPRGHRGVALCWPCVCCFHALPYGCVLTGGPAVAVHSWDEGFLARSVDAQVERNLREILVERRAPAVPPSEVVALRRLRGYDRELSSGVELMVFSNNNRGQTMAGYAMDQPLAEWLRTTIRSSSRRVGFAALVAAHRGDKTPGVVRLARAAFRQPERIVPAAGRFLAGRAARGVPYPSASGLAALCFSYVDEVMGMDQQVLGEIDATASRVAAVLGQRTAGQFNRFYADFKQPARLRAWLRREAVDWALRPPPGQDGPLLTTRGYELLFDPGQDSRAWFHRELFLIAVLDRLHRVGWRPGDADEAADALDEDEDAAVDETDGEFTTTEEEQ